MKSEATTPPTRTEALAAFVKLARAAESVTARSFAGLANSGLTPSQFAVLEALLHKGALTQSQLAHKILRSGGNLTMVVDNLEKQELVERERSREDRRVITVHLTRKGDELIHRVFPQHAKRIQQEMSALTSHELQQLGRLCKKLGLREEIA
jgi:MarR family 2-MHQ and catechol resistance regulon transcriptional repressor